MTLSFLLPLLIVLITITLGYLFVLGQAKGYTKNLQELADKINGKVTSVKSKYLFEPLDVTFSGQYKNFRFTITIREMSSGIGKLIFQVGIEPNCCLIPLIVWRKKSWFALSREDYPQYLYDPLRSKYESKNSSPKEITINKKKFFIRFDSDKKNIFQNDFQNCLQNILSQFNDFEVKTDLVRLTKRWARTDSNSQEIIQLLDNVSVLINLLKA